MTLDELRWTLDDFINEVNSNISLFTKVMMTKKRISI